MELDLIRPPSAVPGVVYYRAFIVQTKVAIIAAGNRPAAGDVVPFAGIRSICKKKRA